MEFWENKKLFFFLLPFGETTDDFLIFRPVQMKVQIALREFCKMCAMIRFEARKKNNKNFSFSFQMNFCERDYGGDLSVVCTYIIQ